MQATGTTALWLTVVVAAWAVVTARAGGARDRRLLASGARGLHSAAVLLAVALLARLLDMRIEAMAAAGTASTVVLIRALWATMPAALLVLCTAAGIAAALVPMAAAPATPVQRARAHLVAGLLVGVLALATLGARAWLAGEQREAATAPELFHWTGIAFRVAYAAGLAMAAVPAALAHVPVLAAARLRWTLSGAATVLAALALGAWARHAGIAPAPELDPAGGLVEPVWTTVHVLLLVPLLLYAASALVLWGEIAGGRPRSRVASALLLIVGAIGLSVFGPAVLDWVGGREVALGVEVVPLRGWEAILASSIAAVAAALAATRAMRQPDAASRSWHLAQSGFLATVALAVAAMSAPPQHLELLPGAPGVARAWGQEWRLSSQGASQEEAAAYDGALVAFEIASGGGTRLESAGERIYRDTHGHPDARVAVPGLVRGVRGDLRFTVRALRGDEALVRVQFHPLAAFAWLAVAFTVVMLGVTAVTLPRVARGGGTP